MKNREEYISILEQDNVELKKKVDELNRFKFSCKKDETRIPATIYSKKTVEDLIKENQELKKQLEETDRKLFLTKHELDMREKTIDNKLNQQKEFMKWLKDNIDNLREIISDNRIENNRSHLNYLIYKNNLYTEILKKYKSITGVSDEKEN